jgi:RNA polymerase sigma-70 factor (ECF subfamily)
MGAEPSVREMYLEGRRRWPLVTLAFDAFELHCRGVFGPEASEGGKREGADLYLCCACVAGEPEALRTFEREGLDVARAAIARVDRDADFVQETLQEVWDKLLLGPTAKVSHYSGRGPLQAWIRVAATRAALDRCRARNVLAARQTALSDRLAAPGPSPDLALTRARYGRAFQKALRAAVAALSGQERNVLRMHVVGQCSIDEIGRAYNVHRATAARWLERARSGIFEAVRRELSSQHAELSDSEFRSLARMMGSELELSLTLSSVHASLGQPHSAS